MTAYHELLPIAVKAIERASTVLREQPPGALTPKGERDVVSELDYQIERDLRAFLHDLTPDIGFLGEEEGISGSGDLQWALDPIDGTANFVRGLPLCGISLGLIDGGQPVLGVIDLPFLNRQYVAARGEGAYANGQRIEVSSTTTLNEAIVGIGDYAVGPGATGKNELRLALTAQLAQKVLRIRMTGSAALDLAWLAEGRLDAALTLSNHPWDMTAGVAIATEAGAVIVDGDGTPYTRDSSVTLGTTPALTDLVLSHLAAARASTTGCGRGG
ncbi:inositol monophosphatase family protein [Plantactinospora endophytica]|uniref:Inositol-1-monophosphatase n=1 Tax=Plantactinospora endophytica TaxID=673535 RepID=A0ABQ4DSP1_9ACTN|nr:inositol monophosphatase family protein [Plantactinospora endophytica]GIG85480.1 inositol monophosphatase [Plantactinospora endophytica]